MQDKTFSDFSDVPEHGRGGSCLRKPMKNSKLNKKEKRSDRQLGEPSARLTRLKSSTMTGFLAFLAVFGSIVACGAFLTLAIPREICAREVHDEALIRYYVEIAADAFQRRNIFNAIKPFSVAVVVRRFTLNSEADTLQLDTAIVRTYFTPKTTGVAKNLPDTLQPDSQLVLRSSFLNEEPDLPALFVTPSWEGHYVYSMFPNDPGRGDISIAYDSPAEGGGLSSIGSSGVFTIDRSSGTLRYATLLVRSDDAITRYSRETFYTNIDGFIVPERIIEHISKLSVWGNQFEIRETRLLKLRFSKYE